MVKGNDLVKEHQVHIVKVAVLCGGQLQPRLAVFGVVVGKVAHQPAGKGGQLPQSGAFVPLQQGSNMGLWTAGKGARAVLVNYSAFAVLAVDLRLGIKAQEGVPPGAFLVFAGLQHIAVAADGL